MTIAKKKPVAKKATRAKNLKQAHKAIAEARVTIKKAKNIVSRAKRNKKPSVRTVASVHEENALMAASNLGQLDVTVTREGDHWVATLESFPDVRIEGDAKSVVKRVRLAGFKKLRAMVEAGKDISKLPIRGQGALVVQDLSLAHPGVKLTQEEAVGFDSLVRPYKDSVVTSVIEDYLASLRFFGKLRLGIRKKLYGWGLVRARNFPGPYETILNEAWIFEPS